MTIRTMRVACKLGEQVADFESAKEVYDFVRQHQHCTTIVSAVSTLHHDPYGQDYGLGGQVTAFQSAKDSLD